MIGNAVLEFVQADGEQPSTSRSLEEDEPDDLSDPLSSTATEPGALFLHNIMLSFKSVLFVYC